MGVLGVDQLFPSKKPVFATKVAMFFLFFPRRKPHTEDFFGKVMGMDVQRRAQQHSAHFLGGLEKYNRERQLVKLMINGKKEVSS